MRNSFKKSLAASAVLASSIATGVGFAASAQATTAGPSTSPLTITNGTGTVLENGKPHQYQGDIDGAQWAPDGSRIAWADGHGNIFTERAEGSTPLLIAPAVAGVTRSHPTWADEGKAIIFSETANGVTKLRAVPAYTAPGVQVQETDPLSQLGPGFKEGGDSSPDSNGGLLAFQHHNTTSGKDEIWVQDFFGRGSAGPVLLTDDGTSPTVSPDDRTVAFVRTGAGGREQIFTAAYNGQDPEDPPGPAQELTSDAQDHFIPTYSPDGTRIAYETRKAAEGAPDGVQSIAVNNTGLRQESTGWGTPAYQPLNTNHMVRLSGSDRLGTAIAASQSHWQNAMANTVVLSRSDQFADALGGSTLAVAKGGPLLLTPSDHLDTAVKAEITRVLGKGTTKTVYVLGGEQALSPAVYNQVKALGYTVKRLAGADRYTTSIAIAQEIQGDVAGWTQPQRVLVATGNLAPDALSAGAAAEASGNYGPSVGIVLLTNDKIMPPAVKAYLGQIKAHDDPHSPTPVYGVGGQANIALNSIGLQHTGLVGSDRYETSYLVAKTFFGGWDQGNGTTPTSVGFATGLEWPDALSGGAFMGDVVGPLLLVNPATNGQPAPDAEAWLQAESGSITTGYVFGGYKAVPQVDAGLANLISPMGGPVTYSNNPKP